MTIESFADVVRTTGPANVRPEENRTPFDAGQLSIDLQTVLTPNVIKRADRDGSGALDAHELQHSHETANVPGHMAPALKALSERMGDVENLHRKWRLDDRKGATKEDFAKLNGRNEQLIFLDRMTDDTFNQIDRFKDGKLTLEEISAFSRETGELSNRVLARYLTDNYGAIIKESNDESGTESGITQEDMKKHRQKVEADPAIKILQDVVADLNKGVSQPEALVHVRELAESIYKAFGEIDSNDDHQLDEKEIASLDPKVFGSEDKRNLRMAELTKQYFGVLAAMADGNGSIGVKDLNGLWNVAGGSVEPYFKRSWLSGAEERKQFNQMAYDLNGLPRLENTTKIEAKPEESSEGRRTMTKDEELRLLRTLVVIDTVLFFFGGRRR